MHRVRPLFKAVLASLAAALFVSCGSPVNNASNSSNNAALSTSPAAASNVNKAKASPSPTASVGGGVIDVASTPPGAAVILVRVDEGGSGIPERKGSTPVSITGVAPGKYSITLEKTGFKFFQREVVVKEDKTSKIAANLKRG